MLEIINVGLPVALLGIAVVFFMLIVLIIIIIILLFLDEKIVFKKQKVLTSTQENSSEIIDQNISIEHLVVITAAIADMMGSDVRIKSIKECTANENSNAWALSSRLQRRQLQ